MRDAQRSSVLIRRLLRQLALLGLLIVGAGALTGGQWRFPVASASTRPGDVSMQAGPVTTQYAGVVIRFGDNRVATHCVSFTEPFIPGNELLQNTGLPITMNDRGQVCNINSQGCPREDCLCQQDPDGQRWTYYHQVNGNWELSSTPANLSLVTPGSVDGWSLSAGDFVSGVKPPLYTFEMICPALAPTHTPTVTATPGATQQPTPQAGPGAGPTISFSADKTSVSPNGCAVLTWVIWDATQAALNGSPISGQDRLEVCPASTQSYTLTASNAAGQTMREIVIQVTGSGANQSPLATPDSPTNAAPAPAAQFSPVQTPLATGWFSTTQQTPMPVTPEQLTRVDQAAASQPDSEQASEATPTPTVYYTFVAPSTSTPRPRQALDTDGPTPTPILLALAAPAPPASNESSTASGNAASGSGPPRLAVESREFSSDLLPGYAMYLLATASLLAAGVWVVRRKGPPGPDR
jgi:hypothetical protein